MTNILFVGDVVGPVGRRTLAALLPGLREELSLDATIVNGENAAGGAGITAKTAEELFAAGADAITLGNHSYRHREVYGYLAERAEIVRPYNFLPSQPGRGFCTFTVGDVKIGVVNLLGNLFLDAARPAFVAVEAALREPDIASADHVVVDLHAEATSEKVAMGWNLDNRVTAVVGTHTHVPTNDARILPGGTAYITDVGMTGARDGVIGVVKEQSIEHLRSRMPVSYTAAEGDPWLMGALIRCSAARRADTIEPILRPLRP